MITAASLLEDLNVICELINPRKQIIPVPSWIGDPYPRSPADPDWSYYKPGQTVTFLDKDGWYKSRYVFFSPKTKYLLVYDNAYRGDKEKAINAKIYDSKTKKVVKEFPDSSNRAQKKKLVRVMRQWIANQMEKDKLLEDLEVTTGWQQWDESKETFVYGGMTFDVDQGHKLAKNYKEGKCNPKEARNPAIPIDAKHAKSVKLEDPVLFATVLFDGKQSPMMIDGNHRVAKAINNEVEELPSITLSLKDSLSIMRGPIKRKMAKEARGLGLVESALPNKATKLSDEEHKKYSEKFLSKSRELEKKIRPLLKDLRKKAMKFQFKLDFDLKGPPEEIKRTSEWKQYERLNSEKILYSNLWSYHKDMLDGNEAKAKKSLKIAKRIAKDLGGAKGLVEAIDHQDKIDKKFDAFMTKLHKWSGKEDQFQKDFEKMVGLAKRHGLTHINWMGAPYVDVNDPPDDIRGFSS